MYRSNRTGLAALSCGVIVGTALAATLVVGVIWLAARTRGEDDAVRRALAAQAAIAHVARLVEHAEPGAALDASAAAHAPHDDAAAAWSAALAEIATLVADDLEQRQAAGRLSQVLAARHNQRSAAGDESRDVIRDVRETLAETEAAEARLLAAHRARAAATATLLRMAAVGALLVICAVGGVAGLFARRAFRELAAARGQLAAANLELLDHLSWREQAEGKLRQARKTEAIGQLTRGLAHDFNNMLAVIGSSLALMERRIKRGDFEIERFIAAAETAVERAATLTRSLLAFARGQPRAKAAIDVDRTIANLSNLLRSTLGEHIRIETVLAECAAIADAHQLENAIVTLAIDARDAMPEGGRLIIETANVRLDAADRARHAALEPGDFVRIAVTDTGIRVPEGLAARGPDPSSAGPSTGRPGLTEAREFAKASGGQIEVCSKEGGGTTVKLYLRREIETGEPRPDTAPLPAKGGLASEVILVVEDDPLMRRLSVESLQELGYTVMWSATAAGALALIDGTGRIKLLFADLVMPDLSGKRLADEARRRQPGLKVLFTTGYTQSTVAQGGALDPEANVLRKPSSLDELAAHVRAALDG